MEKEGLNRRMGRSMTEGLINTAISIFKCQGFCILID